MTKSETIRRARLISGSCSVLSGALALFWLIETLVAQHRAGITHLSMRVSWPGMAQDDILAGIEMLGKQVLPEVRRRTAAA